MGRPANNTNSTSRIFIKNVEYDSWKAHLWGSMGCLQFYCECLEVVSVLCSIYVASGCSDATLHHEWPKNLFYVRNSPCPNTDSIIIPDAKLESEF